MDSLRLKSIFLDYVDKKVFEKGKRCYNNQIIELIDAIQFEEEINIIGRVPSESENGIEYSTEINIDLLNEELTHTSCECMDFKNNSFMQNAYVCKHIMAMWLKYISNLDGVDDALKTKPKLSESELILSALNFSFSQREFLTLDINLKFVSTYREEFFEAEFKIGNRKKYVLKNIEEFIKCKEKGGEIVYGKEFCYNPSKYCFSKEDEELIDFISEYSSLSTLVNTNASGRMWLKIARGKTLVIAPEGIKRFLKCVKHKNINFIYENVNYDAKVKEENLPIRFDLKDEEEAIILTCNDICPITFNKKGDVLFLDGVFYIPSGEQVEKLKVFLGILKEKHMVSFKKSYGTEIFNKVLPSLEAITDNVHIDKSLQTEIVRRDLNIKFYIDRNKDDVFINVELNYGKNKFDILTLPDGDKYIIRDLKKEYKVIELLQSYRFYSDKNKFVFKGDEEFFYEFLNNGLEKLGELGEVYYSQDFKEQKFYKKPTLKATISEGIGNYLDFSFEIEDIDEKEIKNILKSFKENKKFYKLKDSSILSLENNETKEFLLLLDNLNEDGLLNKNKITIGKNKAIYLNDIIEEKQFNFIEGKDFVEGISNKIKNLNVAEFEIPKGLKTTLRDYQIKGYKWLKTLNYYGFGGILSDEMGLGKTIQTIAFLLSEKGKKSIIITPTSLIYNWKNEFEVFAPSMNIVILHGDKNERMEIMKSLKDFDVILTTYGTLRNDFSEYENKEFDYCIIDEGQNIKNPLAQSSESVKEINAKVKFALTGTPIENNLLELWSIFDFIMPGYLYGKGKFTEKFIKKEDNLEELKRLIRPFILRRLKKDVMKELPDKIEKKFFVEMTDTQKKVYKSFVDNIRNKVDEEGFVKKNKIEVFSYLTKLRQFCLDPSVVLENYNGGSGKMNILTEILNENIDNGHKILLFSQFTSVLKNIGEVLDKEHLPYYYLDGSTKASDRIKMVNEFNTDENKRIFLISLKAGGTGLNLTSADVVIHFDPWWNPAVEEQATDRAHRYGQKNVVEVIKLVAKGTIEEKILTLQESKKEMIDKVISGDLENVSFLNSLSEGELLDLFK